MEKRAFLFILIVGILVIAFISTGANAQTKTAILKGVTAFPKGHLNNYAVLDFVEAINQRAQGRLKIDWLGGPEVFPSFDQIHALRAGTIDMILHTPAGYLKSVMPEADAKGLSQLCEWEERKSGAFELWSEIFEKKANAKYLGRFHNFTQFHIYCNRKIEKIEDFKGLNIRVMPLYTHFVKSLGANPVTIPPTDIYTSMERGVVNGFIWPRVGMIGWGLHEVTKYMIEPGIFQIEPVTIINLDSWKKIPNDLQNLLMDVMRDYEFVGGMGYILISKKEDAVREKAGMKILTLPPADAAKYTHLAYETSWEEVIKAAPEYGPKLKKATSRDAVPKGTFPW